MVGRGPAIAMGKLFARECVLRGMSIMNVSNNQVQRKERI